MQSSDAEIFTKLRQAQDVIDALLLRAKDVAGRSALLAEMLQFLGTGAALSACVLGQGAETGAAALDESGASRPEWAALIREQGTGNREQGTAQALDASFRSLFPVPCSLVPMQAEVRYRDRVYGYILLAVPREGDAGAEAVRGLLTACARHLAASLERETLEHERAALAEEAAGNARMAEIGEVSVPVAHEFNNFLNALLLHTAVLKLQLPESMHQGLADLRRQATAAAALIQQMQRYRRRPQPTIPAADLNLAVRSAVAALGGAVPVRLDLAAGAPPAPGDFADWKRLCVFLLRNAVGAAARSGGEVLVRTLREEDKTILRVEDSGSDAPAEGLARLFEPMATAREGTGALELAACKTLSRRLQASIRAESRSEGGVAVVVEWAATGDREQ